MILQFSVVSFSEPQFGFKNFSVATSWCWETPLIAEPEILLLSFITSLITKSSLKIDFFPENIAMVFRLCAINLYLIRQPGKGSH